jgi:hypothetical protein
MAGRQRDPAGGATTSRAHTRLQLELILTLAVCVGATMSLRAALPPDALLPALASLLFALAICAAAAAGFSRARSPTRSGFIDVAALFACAGMVASIMIDTDQLLRLIAQPPPD